MKLFNTIVVWDVYAIAETPEAARDAVLDFITKEGLKPSEQVARPVTSERSIREAWKAEKPMVAVDVSDDDFETLKGKTTMDVFNMLHTKQPELPLEATKRGKK